MYAYRTLITHARYGCLVGCCLAGLAASPVLAAVNSNGIELLSSSSTGVKSGQYIEAAASVRYQHVNTSERIYTKALVPVPKSTLRRGALAALRAGVMHPGFQVALIAAGFIIGNDGEIYSELFDPDNNDYSSYEGSSIDVYEYYQGYFASTTCNSPAISGIITCFQGATSEFYGVDTELAELTKDSASANKYTIRFSRPGTTALSYNEFYGKTSDPGNLYDPSTVATEQDLETVDAHIPPQLYDELYAGGPLPVWQDEITVLGAPASYVQPTGDQAVAPEVASKAGKWAQNVAAQLDGDPLPNPDTDSDGMSADEKLAEDLGLDGPVPPYPDPEIDWQTETLTLPDYSSGVGPGACPAPVEIPFPLGGGTFGWSYEPVCETAEMIRPAFLGVCGFVSLLIVLRARGGNG